MVFTQHTYTYIHIQPRLVGFRLWPKAIPQFEVGHFSTLQGAKEAIVDAGLDGLVLAGNYVHGVALGKCIEGGYDTAREVLEALSKAEGKSVTVDTEMSTTSSISTTTTTTCAPPTEQDEELFV